MASVSTLSQLVDETLLSLAGYGAPNDRATFLAADVTDSGLLLLVLDGSAVAQGIAEIDSELVYIESVTGNEVTISPDGRGFYGTVAAAHDADSRLTMSPVWPRSRVTTALNDAIEGTYPTLFGLGSYAFTNTGVQNTYPIPADCEQILSMTASHPSPTREQQNIRRYYFNAVADTSQFATGKTVTIEEGVFPGASVTLTYRKAPSAIDPTDDFTASGLRATARIAVRYGAMSELVAGMDSERLVTGTAQADQFETKTTVGTAAKISAQLYQRYLLELENERQRLAAKTPVPITVRTR